MTPGATWLLRLALALAVLAYGITTADRPGTWLLTILLLASPLPWRVELDQIGKVILLLGCVVVMYVVRILLAEPVDEAFAGLRLAGSFLALVAILYAVALLWVKNPWRGSQGATIMALVGVFSLGVYQDTTLYPALGAAFVLAVLALRFVEDPGRPHVRTLSRRAWVGLALGLLLTAGVATGIATALPIAHRQVMDGLGRNLFGFTRSGFGSRFALGSLAGMVQSDEVVLRVHGDAPEHLRGIVYSSYDRGRWLVGTGTRTDSISLPAAAEGADEVIVRSVGGDRGRYFLPLEAQQVAADLTELRVNSLGLLLPPLGEEAAEVRFTTGPRDRLTVAPPGTAELHVPAAIAPELTRLAREWTVSATTPQAQLAALTTRLKGDYQYSLSFERRAGQDPLLDFLLRERQGHCEYFASALALLARTLEIPTRVIGGYRVSEYNHLGDYYPVRERNAHAWVEAWIPGRGWQTHEPTPDGGLAAQMPERASTLAAVGDLVAAWFAALLRWFARLTLGELVLYISVMILFWIGIRAVRRLRGARQVAGPDHFEYRAPLPGLEHLLEALAGRGVPRRPREPLEWYARRLTTDDVLDAAAGQEAARLLARYAAWRYGGRGEPAELDRALANWGGN